MKIEVNGRELEVKATSLKALIAELDFNETNVATALNQNFVRKLDRSQTMLKAGDRVEIVAPRQGG